MGNVDNGIEVDGTAHGDLIGGPQPTFNIIPENVISGNGSNGVVIDGHAHSITVNNSYIGTDVFGQSTRWKRGDGVYLGLRHQRERDRLDQREPPDGHQRQPGRRDRHAWHRPATRSSARLIGTDANGTVPMGNAGNGILRRQQLPQHDRRRRRPERPRGPANLIAFNDARRRVRPIGNRQRHPRELDLRQRLVGIELGTGANLNQAAPVLTSSSSEFSHTSKFRARSRVGRKRPTRSSSSPTRPADNRPRLPRPREGEDQRLRRRHIHL